MRPARPSWLSLVRLSTVALLRAHVADYKPVVDYEKWPRTNVHRPVAEANPSKAWAWRAEAGDALDSSGKILSGKTVVFKDTICMAGVPLLFGTDAFEGYIREHWNW